MFLQQFFGFSEVVRHLFLAQFLLHVNHKVLLQNGTMTKISDDVYRYQHLRRKQRHFSSSSTKPLVLKPHNQKMQ